MFVEVVFHSTFGPTVTEEEILQDLVQIKRVAFKNNLKGASLVHSDEILHVLQGEKGDIENAINCFESPAYILKLKKIFRYDMDRLQFSSWKICAASMPLIQEFLGEDLIPEQDYVKNYLYEKRGPNTSPYRMIAGSILTK